MEPDARQPAPDLEWTAQEAADEFIRLLDALRHSGDGVSVAQFARMVARIPTDALEAAAALGLVAAEPESASARRELRDAHSAVLTVLSWMSDALMAGDHERARGCVGLLPAMVDRHEVAEQRLTETVMVPFLVDAAVLEFEAGSPG